MTREYGTGTIRKRPDGRWEARIPLPDGKRKSYYGDTKKAVAVQLKAARHESRSRVVRARTPSPATGSLRPRLQLQEVSIDAMARATGLSAGYCSFVRRGLKTPHMRHWAALEAVAAAARIPAEAGKRSANERNSR